MATILEVDEVKNRRANGQNECPPIDKSIMEQIMVDPMGCLDDDTFMLEYVVENGINASLLCEALEVEQLRINIQGTEYKMFYCKPHPMFEHSDVMFCTDKFRKYKNGYMKAQTRVQEEIIAEFAPLPSNTSTKAPIFQQI